MGKSAIGRALGGGLQKLRVLFGNVRWTFKRPRGGSGASKRLQMILDNGKAEYIYNILITVATTMLHRLMD